MSYPSAVIFMGALLSLASPVLAKSWDLFPRPPALTQDIRFWTRVYTEIDNNHGFIHDNHHLNVVYETISVPANLNWKTAKKRIQDRRQHYQAILLRLAEGNRQNLTKEEQRVLKLWPQNVSNQTLHAAAARIRFQRGQANRFRAGLIRAGAYKPFIFNTLHSLDLPRELAVLPHVESSFNPAALSHAGAAGLWQFTRSTGRRFLRIDQMVDERLDPFKATVAAARLLQHNYKITGSWPLAITAYNHGAAGMRRAKEQVGTSDIVAIRQHYKSPTFGFASRNFYVAFLAALDVDTKAKHYFGPFQPHKPEKSEVIALPDFVPVDALQRAWGLEQATLKQSNPALRSPIWNGHKYVPRGYELRVPCIPSCRRVKAIASLAPWERFERQVPDRFHKVQRGQTLSHIAQRYRIKVRQLVKLNGLSSRHHIRVGQVLQLPLPADGLPTQHYTVQRGDTLSGIAHRFGITEQALLQVNGITNKHRIYAGQNLRLVSSSGNQVSARGKGRPSRAKTTSVVLREETTPTKVGAIQKVAIVIQEEGGCEPLLPPECGPALSADPSNYAVTKEGTIEVQATETLGHYAHWLELNTKQLRNINSLPVGRPVIVGQRLRLDFSRITTAVFEARRQAYHRRLQETFFEQYRIIGTEEHVVQQGESLWLLAQQKYQVPLWLLRQYNPDLDFSAVVAGTRVVIPRLARREEKSLPVASVEIKGKLLSASRREG
ncbi:LysM peptidoglycan-binding domain-containing protein [Nitrosococcus wardiae]|uniref:LysM peptidoglycan-binding domain-containing protein n=1 Tax=Nitrosococcus wardiae TaxID=1814290 RepID=A0A4P7BY48_9GAMM|nr:LysM peptidoglycan-binding domain-containing protein [Nitrosococcus wardiae]QBQ54149.1 LysM peptidoglycan-binding domain-containing protein [Nitrosococcus wardiae]